MNISIITVYNNVNSGSFLQALALKKILEIAGHTVTFLKRKSNNGIKYCLVTSLKKLLKLRFLEVSHLWKAYFSFKVARTNFPVIPVNKVGTIDCFAIGSDTLWNFGVERFEKEKKRYLGLLFPEKRSVSYATSIANTKYEVLLNDNVIVNGLNKLGAISVRDAYTKEIVDKITGKESTLVLDPTLLLSREEFAKLEAKCSDSEYILIYMFERLNKEMEEKITELRQKTGKKIVSFGGHRAFADINISNDPFKFLYYFNHADMIITNTFHGTIFSIINRKPFADFGGHKKKVTELLDMLDLSSQLCETPDDIEKILNQKIDYDKVEEKLSVMREQSKDYLFNALKG